MTARPILTFLCLLVPLVAGGDPLDEYGRLIAKTILRPTALPHLPDSITADLPADKTNAIARIERAFSEQGLAILPDGPHFVRIIPKADRDSLTNAPLRGAELAPSKASAMPERGTSVEPGMIDFRQADLSQVLEIHAALTQRTVLRSITLPSPPICLATSCLLNKDELVYALKTVLALNGICVVDDGSKFVQVVPIAMRDAVTTGAANPEPGAKLFDPKKVPDLGFSETHVPQTPGERIEQEFERLRKAFDDFMHMPDPNRNPARRLLGLYAVLAGKTVEPSKNFDARPIWFHVQTPLTKSELLYAIDKTFELNGLAIIPVDEHRIRLGALMEVLKYVNGHLQRVPPPR
jgi:hypothetical protein